METTVIPEPTTTADELGELFGVHIPELQLSAEEYAAAFELVQLHAGESYLELGSGHGTGLTIAARDHGAAALGIEYLQDANERALALARHEDVSSLVSVRREDLRTTVPTNADVLHMHLGPAFHDLLAPRLERLLTPDTRVIAAGWRVPGWLPLPGSEQSWDAGYIYRPADPNLQLTWQPLTGRRSLVTAHADLEALEVRIDGAPAQGLATLSSVSLGRGQQLLVELDVSTSNSEITIWARCRAGRFTARGPARASG